MDFGIPGMRCGIETAQTAKLHCVLPDFSWFTVGRSGRNLSSCKPSSGQVKSG